MTHKMALQALLKGRRERIDPESHGFVRTPNRQGRRARGLSQSQVDRILNRASGVYHRLETGTYTNPPHDLLADVAKLFRLDEQEWVSLCRYARASDPPGPLYPRSGKEVPGAWQDAVDGMSHMAYVTDCSWELLAHNAPFANLFPHGEAPTNTLRWMLLDHSARDVLADWDTAWAPFVLPQLRTALAARPQDEVLRAIEADVLVDPDTGPLYEQCVAYIHPDGDERPLQHPELGRGWVTMCAAQPMSAPGARIIVLVYRPGAEQAGRLPALRAV
ncbi:XRE family transcriptional regulator [Streptomyces sp. NPDC021093]|uniref:MmyB family transcriptional regulator n=1 Tax=Streptomyces sp. NPDC021093 TaxID=3365112 RepID=UPI00378F9381